MTSKTIRQLLEEAFDFKLVETIVRYEELPNVMGLPFPRIQVLSESRLPTNRTGVTMLLGKNGSGKSRFLKALGSFTEFNGRGPRIILRFAIPTIEQHLEYLDVVDGFKRRPEYADEVARTIEEEGGDFGTVDVRDFNLRFHDQLIESFTVPAYEAKRGFELVFGTTSSTELLDHFGFSEAEVEGFRNRRTRYLDRYSPEEMYSSQFRGNLNFRDYFPEYFLFMLQGSEFNRGENAGPGSWFDCSQMVSDRKSRIDVVREIRWIFENATFLEVTNRNGLQFSFVADPEASDVDARAAESRRRKGEEYDNVTYPFDLTRTDQRSSTAWADYHSSSGQIVTLLIDWIPFDIVDLTFQSREKAIDDVRSVFHNFLRIAIEPADSPDFIVVTQTDPRSAEVLAQSGKLLRESDIGIAELRVKGMDPWPMNRLDFIGGGVDGRRRSVDFLPVIEWRGPGDEEWRQLEKCSDGQLDYVRIIVRLVAFISKEHDRQLNVLVIDEFNRLLHPTVSQVLLEQLDRYGKKFGARVIASTHSFASLEIHRYPQILAERDELGLHWLSTGASMDKLALAAKLGVPQRLITELRKVIVLVEGEHDEVVISRLLDSNPVAAEVVELVNLRGLFGLSSQWWSWLRHETADVVLVYDKRNEVIEAEWAEMQAHARKARIKENLLTRRPTIEAELRACEQRIRRARRADERVAAGDTETRNICAFLRDVVESSQEDGDVEAVATTLSRVHLHGLSVPDIVDVLPIGEFGGTGQFGSWVELRRHESNVNLGADAFKAKFDVKTDRVRRAVDRSLQDGLHPELQRLFARVMGIVEAKEFGDDPRNDPRG